MTRREVLTGAAGAAAAASVGGIAGCFPSVGGKWPDAGPDVGPVTCEPCETPDGGGAAAAEEQPPAVIEPATVVTIQRDDSIDARGKSLEQAQLEVVEDMVNALLTTLAGGAANPWSVLLPGVGRCTRIGLKVNCLNGYLPTSPAVVRAVIKSLVEDADVCAGNIIVWDMLQRQLADAKYEPSHLQGAHLVATLEGAESPGYSEDFFGQIEGHTPRLSRILLEKTDVTINLPVLKGHGESGVTGALKNVYGVIHNPGTYHHAPNKDNTDLQTALPAIYALPPIRKSIKLTIMDALQATINGTNIGPPDSQLGRIFASRDPLALDYYAVDLVSKLRVAKFRGKPVESNLTKWLENAYTLGLGAKSYNLVELSPDGQPVDGATVDGGATVDTAID